MSKNKYKNNEALPTKGETVLSEEDSANDLNEEIRSKKKREARKTQDSNNARYPSRTDNGPSDGPLSEESHPDAVASALVIERLQRVDVWDNAQTKVRQTTDLYASDHLDDGGVGEFHDQLMSDGIGDFQEQLITDTVLVEEIEKNNTAGRITRRDQSTAGSGQAGPQRQRGFPWWWILLPLIILGIIYGLTREPSNEVNQPVSSTTQIQDRIFIMDLADPLVELPLIRMANQC